MHQFVMFLFLHLTNLAYGQQQIDPFDCNSVVTNPFSTNEFVRWVPTNCLANNNAKLVKVINRTDKCLTLSFEGHTDLPLVESKEVWEDGQTHKISTAVLTAQGPRACQPSCTATYTMQPTTRATLVAQGYNLPQIEPRREVINGARFHVLVNTHLDSEHGVVAELEQPVTFYREFNDTNQGTLGDRIMFTQGNSPCPALQ